MKGKQYSESPDMNLRNIDTWKKSNPIYPVFLTIGILVLISLPIISSLYNKTVDDSIKVNKNTIVNDFQTFDSAVDDSGNIYIAWQDVNNNDINRNNIYLATSTNGGKSFSDRVQINDVNGKLPIDGDGSIVANNNGKVYVAWLDYRENVTYDSFIFFDRSNDSGKTFGDDIKFDPSDGHQYKPTIAVDSANNIYAAWEDGRVFYETGNIFFGRLNYSSSNFTMQKCVYNCPTKWDDQRDPDIVISKEGIIYITYTNQIHSSDWTLYISKSIDGGNSFSTSNVVANWSGLNTPKISAFKDYVYIVWHSNREIFFSMSKNFGMTWSKEISLGKVPGVSWQCIPSMVVDNQGTIYVAWPENYESGGVIKIAKSKNHGKDWTIGKYPNINPESPWRVSLITNNNNDLYLSWADGEEEGWDIYFSKIDTDLIQNESDSFFITISLIAFSTIIVTLLITNGTEFGRYAFLKFFSGPFYSKIRSEDLLKHELRK